MCLFCKTNAEKHLTNEEKQQCLQDFLETNFPVTIWIISIVINISSALIVIGLQIALISVKGKLYFVGAG